VINNCKDVETLKKDVEANIKVENLMKNLHLSNEDEDEH
jgi:hypothetical protein